MNELLGIWLVSGVIFGGFVQFMFSYIDTDSLTPLAAFWVAIEFYDAYHDQINGLGLIIGIAFISIAVLPGSILILFISAIIWILLKMWDAFKFVFRRKE